MTAEELLARLDRDAMARLKWRVMQLGIAPLSPRALLLTRRRVIECACHLALDAGAKPESGAENPDFDMARFRALGG